MKRILGKARRLASTLAAAGLVAFAGSANAVIYVSNWDPLFNLNFSSLLGTTVGWDGSVTIDVAGSCLIPGTQSVPSCGTAVVTGATLRFYDNANDSTLGTVTSWSITPILQLNVDSNGDVIGIDLGASPLTGSTTAFDPNLFLVDLNFAFAGPTLKLTFDGCFGDGNAYPCFQDKDVSPEATFLSGQDGDGYSPTNITWTRVPEPTSLALIGAALLGLRASRRRSKA